MRRRARSADGSATVWLLIVVGVVAMACATSLLTGVAIRLRHRAAAAADAAALTLAVHALDPPTQACADARRAAREDHAALTSCVLRAGVATVTTSVPAPGWLGWLGSADGRARAGHITAEPVEPP